VAVSAEVLVTGGERESYFEAVIKMCQDGRGKGNAKEDDIHKSWSARKGLTGQEPEGASSLFNSERLMVLVCSVAEDASPQAKESKQAPVVCRSKVRR
jgi:hypothetical protein